MKSCACSLASLPRQLASTSRCGASRSIASALLCVSELCGYFAIQMQPGWSAHVSAELSVEQAAGVPVQLSRQIQPELDRQPLSPSHVEQLVATPEQRSLE